MASAPPPSSERVLDALVPVIDPELGASIVDLGLVYAVDVSAAGRVTVVFTSSVPACPLTSILEYAIVQAVSRITGVTSVEARFAAEPPWNPSMISAAD